MKILNLIINNSFLCVVNYTTETKLIFRLYYVHSLIYGHYVSVLFDDILFVIFLYLEKLNFLEQLKSTAPIKEKKNTVNSNR